MFNSILMIAFSQKSLAQGKESIVKLNFKVALFISAGFDDLPDSQSLAGYIHVTGLKFYTLCPPNIREKWFAQFQKMKDYRVHT